MMTNDIVVHSSSASPTNSRQHQLFGPMAGKEALAGGPTASGAPKPALARHNHHSATQEHQNHLQAKSQKHYQADGEEGYAKSEHGAGQDQWNAEQTAVGNGRSYDNSATCGNCRQHSRNSSFAQFCSKDFVVKAHILARRMSEDWTTFDVEIVEMFKWPAQAQLSTADEDPIEPTYHHHLKHHQHQQQQRGAQYLQAIVERPWPQDNPDMMLADQSVPLADTDDHDTGSPMGEQGRMKSLGLARIKTTQTLVMPSEDFTCRCPRLKLKGTYLILGNVEYRNNTVHRLQLDRHGVAERWKVSCLDKLGMYQLGQRMGQCEE